ncbi:META domain-containing protein [Acinetobacter piscicola]|uniref:META domain-containing protein n=1 Tax=Acinetobacter piscicola TaxID=2006115 RepID=UPI000B7D2646|nr:META domain-containing protein [Acinetobacter piscicola]
MLKSAIVTALITTTLLAAGCTSMPNKDQQAKNLSLLQNKTWVLTYIGTTEYKTVSTVNTPIIQFGTDLRVSGTDGCNRLMGLYAIKGEHITLGQLGSTKMLCKNSMQLSAKYSEALNKVTAYQVYDKTLKLLDQHGNRVLQYTTTTP